MDQNQQNFLKPTNHKKIWGYFWWGFSNLGRNQKKKARKRWGRLRNHDQRGSWYQDDVGWNPRWPIFHEGSEIPRRTRRTRGRTERNHKGKHSRTSPITHPLDNQTHKIHKVHEQQRERYKVRFISMRRSWRGAAQEGVLMIYPARSSPRWRSWPP